ncbi:MAG: TetR family transcriptional regulator [Pseudonocardia sp.]
MALNSYVESIQPADALRSSGSRARVAQTGRDRTRRALLGAADTAFGSRGWARTRAEDVAAAAGVSAATAYNHFRTTPPGSTHPREAMTSWIRERWRRCRRPCAFSSSAASIPASSAGTRRRSISMA